MKTMHWPEFFIGLILGGFIAMAVFAKAAKNTEDECSEQLRLTGQTHEYSLAAAKKTCEAEKELMKLNGCKEEAKK